MNDFTHSCNLSQTPEGFSHDYSRRAVCLDTLHGSRAGAQSGLIDHELTLQVRERFLYALIWSNVATRQAHCVILVKMSRGCFLTLVVEIE